VLLIVNLDKHIGNARAWRGTFGEQLPDLEIGRLQRSRPFQKSSRQHQNTLMKKALNEP